LLILFSLALRRLVTAKMFSGSYHKEATSVENFRCGQQSDCYGQPGRVARGSIETTTNTLTINNGFFVNTAALNTGDTGSEEIGAHRGSSVFRRARQENKLIFRPKPSAFLTSISEIVLEELSTKLPAQEPRYHVG
jgi:hypothetical protein